MATFSIKQNFKHVPVQEETQLKQCMTAILNDVTALRAAFVAMTAKVDTDFAAQNAAVTASQLDVNYASTLDPAALELTA